MSHWQKDLSQMKNVADAARARIVARNAAREPGVLEQWRRALLEGR